MALIGMSERERKELEAEEKGKMNSEVREIMRQSCRSKAYGDFVFVSHRTGSRYIDVKRAFRKACAIAGIEGLIWHDLRASFGTRLGEAGVDAFTIASLLGHSNVRTTQRYVRATEHGKRAAVEATILKPVGHKSATRVDVFEQNQAAA